MLRIQYIAVCAALMTQFISLPKVVNAQMSSAPFTVPILPCSSGVACGFGEEGESEGSQQQPRNNNRTINVEVNTPRALALPQKDALQKLESIPVFAVINKNGVPILASMANPKDKNKQVQIATFFMNPQDAQTLVTTLKTQKPDVGNSARVVSLSMRQAYDIKAKNKDKAESLLFEFLPSKQQVDAAVAVLKQNGQEVKQFNDIPLFYSTGGKGKGLLTIEQGKNKVIPFYFNKQDLQGMLDQLKQKDPKLSSMIKIEVTSLSKVFDSLLKENSAGIQQITLVPDRTALEYAISTIKKARLSQ
jgi:Tic22-like family